MCRKINDREFQVQDDINQVNKLLASELRRNNQKRAGRDSGDSVLYEN